MASFLKSFLVIVLALSLNTVVAQKSKLPKLTTVLGSRADSVSIAVEEAIQLIKFPLRVSDDKKTAYPIISYQFLYRRKELTEDERTGKLSPTTSMIANHFTATPLPELWKNNIIGRLQAGEELFFYDIVVKDAAGKLRSAPSVKLKLL